MIKWITAVIVVLALAGLMTPSACCQETPNNWLIMTSVDWIFNGPDDGEIWYDGGSLRRLGTTGNVSWYVLVQAAKPSPDKASGVGGSVVVRDQFSKWVGGVAQIGLVNNLADDQYGWVSKVGVHIAHPDHVFGLAIAGGPYEVKNGRINGWKIGVAPTIKFDSALKWLTGN